MLRAPRQRRRRRSILLGGMSLLFMAVGLGFVFVATFRPLWRAHAAQAWRETSCLILNSNLRSSRDSDGDLSYSHNLLYQHEVDGRTYRGRRESFGVSISGKKSTIEAAVAARPIGARVPCWYDPADPAEITLSREAGAWPGGLVGLLFALAGFAMLREFGGGATPRPRTTPAGGLRLRQRAADPITSLLLLGFGIAMTAPLLAIGVTELGGWSVLLGAIALAIDLVVLHELGQCFVVADLELEPATPRLGEPLRLRYRLTSPTAIRFGRVWILARERVSVTSGDDTTHHDHELHSHVLARLDEARGGAVTLTLPAGVPPTQALGAGRIEWLLRLDADLVAWPNVDVELPLTVEAPAGEAATRTPAQARSGDLRLEVDDDHLEPGQPVRGTVSWDRAAAPEGALRLGFTVSGDATHRELVGEVSLADLPRAPRPGAGADPYRPLPVDERAPLAGRDTRRFEITAPTSPWSYRGSRMRVDWSLQIEIDGELVAIPLVIGAGGRAAGHADAPEVAPPTSAE